MTRLEIGIRLLAFLLLLSLTGAALASVVENDGFCDMGTDEWATGACSYFTRLQAPELFVCGNKEVGQQLFPSRVGDGICDCCDGSDEFLTARRGVVCPDTCLHIITAKREEAERRVLLVAAGKARKEALVSHASKHLAELRNNHNTAVTSLPEFEGMLNGYREDLKREEALEASELERLVAEADVAFGSAVTTLLQQTEVGVTREARMHLIAALTLRGKEEATEAVLAACVGMYTREGADADDTEAIVLAMDSPDDLDGDGSPNLGVPQGVATLDAMVTALALARIEDNIQQNLLRIALGFAAARGVLKLSFRDAGLSSLLTSDSTQAAALDNLPQPPHKVRSSGYVSEPAKALRVKVKEVEENIQRLRDGSADSKKALQMDFGKQDELFVLFHERKCFNFADRQYTYTLCPYGDARQRGTHLGAHAGAVTYSQTNPMQPEMLLFQGGERCMGTSDRRERMLRLFLDCGLGGLHGDGDSADGELGAVSGLHEVEVCVYEARLVTPLVC